MEPQNEGYRHHDRAQVRQSLIPENHPATPLLNQLISSDKRITYDFYDSQKDLVRGQQSALAMRAFASTAQENTYPMIMSTIATAKNMYELSNALGLLNGLGSITDDPNIESSKNNFLTAVSFSDGPKRVSHGAEKFAQTALSLWRNNLYGTHGVFEVLLNPLHPSFKEQGYYAVEGYFYLLLDPRTPDPFKRDLLRGNQRFCSASRDLGMYMMGNSSYWNQVDASWISEEIRPQAVSTSHSSANTSTTFFDTLVPQRTAFEQTSANSEVARLQQALAATHAENQRLTESNERLNSIKTTLQATERRLRGKIENLERSNANLQERYNDILRQSTASGRRTQFADLEQLLQQASSLPNEEREKVHNTLLKRLHPDLLGADPTVAKIATEITKLLNSTLDK